MKDAEDPDWRRKLARRLTARAQASTRDIPEVRFSFGGTTRRVGVTGPPGAGNSSLIALLAKEWLAASRRVGVLAIDPTSPLSGGALLDAFRQARFDDLILETVGVPSIIIC
jgi:LAO/AO transport system kinase